jgi:Secretion system C-terminal sorting domain
MGKKILIIVVCLYLVSKGFSEDSTNFVTPVKSTKWKAGTFVNIAFNKSGTFNRNWNLYCYKIGDTISVLNYAGSKIGLVNLNLPLDSLIDSGTYCLQIYDSFTHQSVNSDTFQILKASPMLTINSPVGGCYLISGDKFKLNWTSVSVDTISVIFSKDGGLHWDTLAENIPSPNSYNNSALITTPIVSSNLTNCILQVESYKLITYGYIYINILNINPYQFIFPNKNSIWTADSTYSIKFSRTSSSYCYIYYKKLDSSLFYIDYSSQNGLNNVNWHIDQFTDSGKYVLAIYDYNYYRYFYSDSFYINPAPPKLTIISPSINYYLISGETFNLNWSAVNSGPINVEISKDGGATWDTVATNINSPTSGNNSASIKIINVSKTYIGCLFKIENKTHDVFSIITGITLADKEPYKFITPDKSTSWTAGDTVNVEFNNNTTNYYYLGYKKIGNYMNSIYWSSQTGLVSYSWNIYVSLDSGYYQMAIYDESLNRYFYSDTFYIAPAPPRLVLTAPLSGITIYSKSSFYIDWTAFNCGNIDIEISKDSGVTWDTIAENIYSYNSIYNSYQLITPIFSEVTTGGILKISNLDNTVSSLVSNLTFSNKKLLEFVTPTKQTKINAGLNIQIVVKRSSTTYTYLDFYYKKIDQSYGNNFNYYYGSDSILTSNWSIPLYLDTGKYQLYVYDEYLGQYFFSDTFNIGQGINPYEFVYPTRQSNIIPGSLVTVKVKNNIRDCSSFNFYYKNILGGTDHSFNIYNANSDSLITFWIVPENINAGKYQIYFYDGSIGRNFYSDTFTVSAFNSIKQISQNNLYFSTFPNPFENNLEISFELFQQSSVEIVIYDLLGKIVKTAYSGTLNAGKNLCTINLSEIQNGAYILQLKASSGILKKQIIVKR